MVSEETYWYVVRTKPHQEKTAFFHLKKQGFNPYLPQLTKTIKHARKVQEVKRPFFPGYLFIRLKNCQKNWTTIGSTIGTVGPVCFGTYYPQVPAQVIEALKAQENKKGCIVPPDKLFKKGQQVVLNTEELGEMAGIFLARDGKDRSIILLDFLQRQVKTSIETDLIEAA